MLILWGFRHGADRHIFRREDFMMDDTRSKAAPSGRNQDNVARSPVMSSYDRQFLSPSTKLMPSTRRSSNAFPSGP